MAFGEPLPTEGELRANSFLTRLESYPILRYFEFEHLADSKLQEISSGFHKLAHEIAGKLGPNKPELAVALRKLLEAKDAAVRSAIDLDNIL